MFLLLGCPVQCRHAGAELKGCIYIADYFKLFEIKTH
jgi:hypothetical protein